MIAPFAGPANVILAASTTGNAIILRKPVSGQSDRYSLQSGQTLDLSQIANENITMVKLGGRLVVLFPDKSFIVVDGLYLSDGSPSPEVRVALDPSTVVTSPQFVAQFPISTDEQILTAAGVNPAPRGSGGSNPGSFGNSGSALSIFSALTLDSGTQASELPVLEQSSSGNGNASRSSGNVPGLPSPIPAGPQTLADSGSVVESGVNPGNTAFSGTPSTTGSVLGNDTLPSAASITGVASGVVTSASGNLGVALVGTYGQLTLNADGTYSYVLNNADPDTQNLEQGASRQDVFTYTVTDTFGSSSSATITMTVTGTNDAPVVTGGTSTGAVTESATGSDVSATGTLTASDVDTGASLVWGGSANGAYGTFSVNAAGVWTYALDNARANPLAQGQVATETFTATVTDEFGATATQSITITVTGTNDAPVVSGGTSTGAVAESATGSDVSAAGTLTASDVDTGASLVWSGNANGAYGTFSVNAAGVWTYALDNARANPLAQGQVATETFTATVTDEFGATATQSVTITVTGTNDAPVVTGGTSTGAVTESATGSDVSATGTLTASDVDTGASLVWSGNANGAYGTFSVNAAGVWTYALDNARANPLAQGQVATETFTATVTDEFGATATQSVTITVTGTNDAPLLDIDTGSAGTGYLGLVAAEAARSTGTLAYANGVSIVQRDESNPALAGLTSVSDADTIDRIGQISVQVAVAGGNRGVLVLDPAAAGAISGSITTTAGNGTATLNLTSTAGFTLADVRILLDRIHFLNTDQTFALDTADRQINITVQDLAGGTATVTAFVPVIADVADTTGLDAFTGTRFNDIIDGRDGDDVISALGGDNTITGGDGDDRIIAGDGNNTVVGGADDDRITLGAGTNTVTGGAGDDRVTTGNGNNSIQGDDGDDNITTGSGNDVITGGDGDDRLTAGDGVNTVRGGAGDDTITSGTHSGGASQIFGDDGDDRITTGNAVHEIFAGLGDDTVVAGSASDQITGGRGVDRITSGGGSDLMIYSDVLVEGGDIISDFQSGTDALSFSAANIGLGLASGGADTGVLDASRFTAGVAFTNTQQRFLFNTANDTLYYDADGSGGASAMIALAELENGGTAVAGDIRIT